MSDQPQPKKPRKPRPQKSKGAASTARRRNLPLTGPRGAERRRIFLDALAQHALVGEAAKAASPGCGSRHAVRSFQSLRREDPEFAAEWDAALLAGAYEVEKELRRRAVDGWLEPVFQKGEQIGVLRRYDSRLLELLVKRVLPEYRRLDAPNVNVDVSATAQAAAVASMDLETTIKSLDEEGQHALRLVCMKLLEAKGELTDRDRAIAADHAARREQNRALAARATANAERRREAPPIIDVQAQEVPVPAPPQEPAPLGHQPAVPEPEPAAAGPELAPAPARVLPFVAPRILR